MTAVVENAYTFNFSQKTGINLNPVQVFEHNYRSGLSKLVNQKLKEEYGDDLKKGYENYISPDKDNFNKFIVRDDSIVFYFDGDTVLPMSEGVVSLELKNDELAGIRRNKINLRAIDPDKPMVALTFDDGPGGKPTKRILDCLKKNGVTATFFDLGENAKSKEGKKIEQLKVVEKAKFLPSDIVKMMKDEGYSKFSMHYHTQLWKAKDAKNKKYNYGVKISKQWYWYENWIDVVRDYCQKNDF